MSVESGLSVADVCIGNHLCPVCEGNLERKELAGLIALICPEKHYQRKTHISDIESKLYVGISNEAA